jgi:hypothetical protein
MVSLSTLFTVFAIYFTITVTVRGLLVFMLSDVPR